MSHTPLQPQERPWDITHRVLVLTDSMQTIPGSMMLAIFMSAALVVRVFWADWTVPVAFYAGAQINALALMLLPLNGRSYGPDRASSLALMLVSGLPCILFGVLGLPSWSAVIWVIGVSVVTIYSTWVEPFQIEVTHQKKSIAGWDAAHPLRLLHLSDLHAEHFGPRERMLNRLVAQLKPDVIVFTGDFINLSNVGNPITRQVIRGMVAEWRAPFGLYAVSGTSPEIDLPEDVESYLIKAENAQSVIDTWATIDAPGGTLHIGGVASWHQMDTDRAALAALLAKKPEGGATVLLAHTPDLSPDAIEAGIDLALSGHTHGGQLCLPGGIPVLTASQLGRQFARGRVDSGKTTVYTSRGIGMEGLGAPRARLFCRPEIILWEISA